MKTNDYRKITTDKIDMYVHDVYSLSKSFPKEELFGSTSQLRRAAMSVVLNYIEGYARFKKGNQLNFLQIAYGSLQESKYLLGFAETEGWIENNIYSEVLQKADEIGALLWTEINNLNKTTKMKKSS